MAASTVSRRIIEVTRICNQVFFCGPPSSRATVRNICNYHSVQLNSSCKGSNGYVSRVFFKDTKSCLPCLERTSGSITLGWVHMNNSSDVTRRMCSTSSRCWNCNSFLIKDKFQKLPFFCGSCNGIQPVDEDISHFQRLEWLVIIMVLFLT